MKKLYKFEKFNQVSTKPVDPTVLEWFVGFFEGDGCLSQGSKGFSFTITQDEIYILNLIKETLGFGNVTKFSKEEKWCYRVDDRYNIYKLLLILNGNLILNQRKKTLEFIIPEFNNRLFQGQPYPYKLEFLLTHNVPTLTDAWFSGFIDTEGHLGCPIETTRKNRFQYISISFEICQNGEVWLFQHLKEILKAGFLAPKIQKEETHNRLILKGIKNVPFIINYLDNHKLLTAHKSKSYILWREMYIFLKNKEHLNLDLLPSLVQKSTQIKNKVDT